MTLDKSTASIVDAMMARLPAGDTVTIPDIVVALNKDNKVVKGWIESGEVDAIDLGGGKNEYWEISKSSLRDFLVRRSAGIRAPSERRLSERQPLLFPELSNERNRT